MGGLGFDPGYVASPYLCYQSPLPSTFKMSCFNFGVSPQSQSVWAYSMCESKCVCFKIVYYKMGLFFVFVSIYYQGFRESVSLARLPADRLSNSTMAKTTKQKPRVH